jgi:hypothetical protein
MTKRAGWLQGTSRKTGAPIRVFGVSGGLSRRVCQLACPKEACGRGAFLPIQATVCGQEIGGGQAPHRGAPAGPTWRAAGGRRCPNPAAKAARRLPDGAGNGLDLSRFETLTTCWRPLIEFADAAAAGKTPAPATAAPPRPLSLRIPRHSNQGQLDYVLLLNPTRTGPWL